MEPEIEIGRYALAPGADSDGVRFLCDAPELERHVGKPWFNAYASERLDIPLAVPGASRPQAMGGSGGTARVGSDLLARHTCVLGATGSGKTRLALHLLAEQLRAGCSVVMLDPKIETIRHLLSLAHSLGMAPEQVTVLSPHLSGAGAPGWNPLDTRASGISPAQAATDVVSVLEKSTSSWGPRMGDLLTNALIVVASHGLSLFELARLLQRDDYREGLLRLPPPPAVDTGATAFDGVAFEGGVAYEEARDFFLSEFAAWSKSERAAAAAPVLNKFRELLRTPFLRSLLCARRTTLHLGALWHKPGLVLVHLDTAALGDEGVRLLGGLLAHQLLRTAMRSDGPVPVVLALDEMGVSEEFVGSAAAKILAIARSRGLRLLVACQHFEQLSESLRVSLLANTAVRAFFRLGYGDARFVAASLAVGTGERVSRIAADVAKRGSEGLPEGWAESAHTVRDGWGEAVAFSAAASQAFWHLVHKADGGSQIEGLKRLARVSGIDRLYVHAADTKQPVELSRYLRGLASEDYRLSGTGPIRLVVRFPRCRLSVLSRETETEREQRWIRTLTELPVRRAVLRLASGQASVVQVAEVRDPKPLQGFDRFLSAAVASCGQTAREVEEAQAWRREMADQVAEQGTHTEQSRAERLRPSQQIVALKTGASPRTPQGAATQFNTKPPEFTPKLQAASLPRLSISEGAETKTQPLPPRNNSERLLAKELSAPEMPLIAEDGSLA